MAWHEKTSWVNHIFLLALEVGRPGCQWEVRLERALSLGETTGKLRSLGTPCVNGGIPLGKKEGWADVQRETKITRHPVIVWVALS